jgi:hypothetical protein
VRGEVFLTRDAFERMNKEREDAGEPLFANPRNAAAGTMRNLEPALVAKRGLSAFMYQLINPNVVPAVRDTHTRTLHALLGFGFPIERHFKTCAGIDEVIAFCEEWADKRRALSFDTDGVVIKVDDLALRAKLGTTAKFRGGPRRSSFRRSRRTRSSHCRQRRPHRRGHAIRVARAGVRRRLDDLDGDAAQRRRHREKRHPRWRHRRHRKGR